MYVDQAEFELQLKVWKDLAIANQVLMRTATDALKLNPDCSPAELRQALNAAIKRSLDADVAVEHAQAQSQQAIATMEKKIAASEKAQAQLENANSEIIEAQKRSEQQMATERAAHINEMKKIKGQLAEKDKVVKAINKALADTPENVMKKMRTLKKQKDDEAAARKQVENSERTLRKEKKQLEQSVKESEDKFNALAGQYRELHALCESLREQLKPLVDDEKKLPTIPELNEELLGGSVKESTEAEGSELAKAS